MVTFPTHRDLFYGGRWHAGKSGRFLDVSNPATGASLGKVVDADAQDVASAVAAARDAFPAWRDAPAQDRARAVRKAAAILREHAQELAILEATDGGNPLQAMLYDVAISADYMDYCAGLVTEIKGSTIPMRPASSTTRCANRSASSRIGAFNHPLLFFAGKCGAPLAADNTADHQACGSDTAVVAAPRGTVAGRVSTGRRQRHHRWPRCRRRAGRASARGQIGFIGSVNGGRAVMTAGRERQGAHARTRRQECADRVRRRQTGEVADGVVRGMNFRYVTGQSCNSTSRLSHDAIYDARCRNRRRRREDQGQLAHRP
jgi:betaine-aldehyde dehydrogenase